MAAANPLKRTYVAEDTRYLVQKEQADKDEDTKAQRPSHCWWVREKSISIPTQMISSKFRRISRNHSKQSTRMIQTTSWNSQPKTLPLSMPSCSGYTGAETTFPAFRPTSHARKPTDVSCKLYACIFSPISTTSAGYVIRSARRSSPYLRNPSTTRQAFMLSISLSCAPPLDLRFVVYWSTGSPTMSSPIGSKTQEITLGC
jgi:hypothetical protein